MSLLPATLDSIRVRFIEPSDIDRYIALERDPEVKRFVNGPSPKSDDQLRFDLLSYKPTTELLAIAESSSNEFIGRCGLLYDSKTNESEVYCLLIKPYWKMGIGQRVVPFLAQLAKSEGRVPVAIVDPSNAGSIALLARLGYQPVGVASAKNYQHGHVRYIL